MTAKLPIQIDDKKYIIVAEEISEEDPCEKCVFCDMDDCPSDICASMFPRCDTHIERV